MFRTRAKVALMTLAAPAALLLAACQGGTLSGGRGGQGGGALGGTTGGIIGPNLDCHLRRPASPARLGVLLLLDGSASMNDDATGMTCTDGCGATSQWALATTAINTVVGLTATSVDWGLAVFADGGTTCSVGGTVNVAVAPRNADAIATTLAIHTSQNGGVSRGSGRPTRAAEELAAAYLSTVSALSEVDRQIIVLVTDGAPTCRGDDTSIDDSEGTVRASQAAARLGFMTSVIGVATGGTDAEATLSQLADPYFQFNLGRYVPVSDSAAMTAALRSIVDDAATCLFAIPPAPNNQLSRGWISVLLAGSEIPIDTTHVNGWDYTDNSQAHLQLFGAACQAALTEPPAPLEVEYHCSD